MTKQPARSILSRASQALRRAKHAPTAAQPGVERPAPRPGMQIHRVRGRDVVDALQRAAQQYGEDALVLSREPAPGGGVTVAVGVHPRPAARATRPDPGRADVRRLLGRSGASEALVARALAAIDDSDAHGAFAIDAAAAALGKLISVAPSPRVRRGTAGGAPPVIAFVGPTGVGKTTTLVKLASRLIRAERRVALVTTDARSLAGKAQLEAYGRLLQSPVVAVEDARRLARSVAQSQHVDAVLVDTSGRSPRDARSLEQLARELGREERAPGLEVYLTVTATAARAALDETLLGFEGARPTALVVTKLDETRAPAPVLEFAAGSGLPVAFLCDGAEVAAHLHRPTPDGVADLLLRGRLA